MTKKHFLAIAAEFKKSVEHARCTEIHENNVAPLNAVKMTIRGFINVAIADNPRFDVNRFLAACGLN